MDWPTLERTLVAAPRTVVAAVAGRAARRVSYLVANAVPVYGPDAWEWLAAVDASVKVVEAFAGGRSVSGFALLLASQLPRTAAEAAAATARRVGPSAITEPLELACAAAAFAADATRAATPARAATLTVEAIRSAIATGLPVERLIELDVKSTAEELWPMGEPPGWAEAWAALEARCAALPRMLELPTTG